jgi:hypothetical protein
MSDNQPPDACSMGQLLPYSSAMRTALVNEIPELETLLDRFRERRGLVPLKARALKGMAAELRVVHNLGLPWIEIWRSLVECGYQGSYRQFWRMAVQLTGKSTRNPQKRKNLLPPVEGKEIEHPVAHQSSQSTEDGGKPEWQIRREEQMARLDRDAELNCQREARLQVKKVFIPSVFVGRSED